MNIFYFDNIKLKNKNIVTLNYIPKKNIYTYDYFDTKLRKTVLQHILEKIKDNNEIIIFSLCRCTCASILYIYELNKIITNKITLILLSPLLSLDSTKFIDKSGFGSNHSIRNIFNNFKNNEKYEDIVRKVFINSDITKICFFSELDPTIPKIFNEQIYKISNNTKTFHFLNCKFHNFFSLFYYCYSKNFVKFKKKNYYINEKELITVSSLWNDNLNIDKLCKCIVDNNFDLLSKYHFIEIKMIN